MALGTTLSQIVATTTVGTTMGSKMDAVPDFVVKHCLLFVGHGRAAGVSPVMASPFWRKKS